jgi:hypothetical protein
MNRYKLLYILSLSIIGILLGRLIFFDQSGKELIAAIMIMLSAILSAWVFYKKMKI